MSWRPPAWILKRCLVPVAFSLGWAREAVEAGGWEFEAWCEPPEAELANVRFERRDVSALGVSEGFDFIMSFDAVHDQARPDGRRSAPQIIDNGGQRFLAQPFGDQRVSMNITCLCMEREQKQA